MTEPTEETLSTSELAGLAIRLREAGVSLAGPLRAQRIPGGRSNRTFRLDDGFSRWVLRTPPREGRTPSAHDVRRELRVTAALAGTGVPVAPAVLSCDDESVLGGPFAVSAFVEGRTIQSSADLADVDDDTLGGLVDRLVETLAVLHAVDYRAVGLHDFGRPDGYVARQVRRWSGQWDLVGPPELAGVAAECFEILADRIPDQLSTGIVHGDYRIDNLLVDVGTTRPTITAVLDWELSTIGDPVADVATMCAYRHPAFDLIVGGASAWTSDRLPDVDGLATAYERAGGVDLSDWDVHLALAHVKIAVIAAGIDHRRRAGSGHGLGFDTASQAVGPFFEAGRSLLGPPR